MLPVHEDPKRACLPKGGMPKRTPNKKPLGCAQFQGENLDAKAHLKRYLC